MSLVTASMPSHRCSGAALLVSLVMLAVLSLLGVSAMQISVRELKLAGDVEDRSRSFHAAQAGINAALTYMQSDSMLLAFAGDAADVSFNSLARNPLANMGADAPTVIIVVSGDRDGNCSRTEFASSDDLIGCGAFEIVSTHAPDTATVKGGARTTLVEGIAQQVVRID